MTTKKPPAEMNTSSPSVIVEVTDPPQAGTTTPPPSRAADPTRSPPVRMRTPPPSTSRQAEAPLSPRVGKLWTAPASTSRNADLYANVLINASTTSVESEDSESSERDLEHRRLIRRRHYTRNPSSPRNNFPSYSNEDVSVRFRNTQYDSKSSYRKAVERASVKHGTKLNKAIVVPGSSQYLSVKYESLDYDICENNLFQAEERFKGYKYVVKKNIARWFIFLAIGICTALIACFVDISIEQFSLLKYTYLATLVDDCIVNDNGDCLWIPYVMWTIMNIAPVLIGAVLVTYVEPVAGGSGIPQIKCYLNGIKYPRVVRIKTLAVKIIGVITSVVGGLAAGKEGPMIHAGAVVAAGISQGKSTTFKKDFGIFKYFREDHEKRDFVSGGAASGVSAAFGSPIGGVLFSIEEGTSFFNQSLTWRTFLASMISMFTLNVVLSIYNGHPGDLSYPGLLNLGKFETMCYQIYEIPLFMIVGAMGGLLGSFWNHINHKISIYRLKYIKKNWMKVIEALTVAAMSAMMGFLMMFFIDDCKPIPENRNPKDIYVQMYCNNKEYSAVAALWFHTPESTVRSLLHDPTGSHSDVTLAVFVILYFFLAACTFGLSVSGGLFIPALLIGSAWGRLVGSALAALCPDCTFVNPGKYALLGAAAQLGGVVRMTISLTAILIEATQGISFGLPIIIVLIIAKWVADFFNEGIYDIHIQMGGVPLLHWEPPPLASNIYVHEIMSHPVITFGTVEKVGHILNVLKKFPYNGFPVVDPPPPGDRKKNTTTRKLDTVVDSPPAAVDPSPVVVHSPPPDVDPSPVVVHTPAAAVDPSPAFVDSPPAVVDSPPAVVDPPPTVVHPPPVVGDSSPIVVNPPPVFDDSHFTVVDPTPTTGPERSQFGRIRGMILRSQLIVLLQNKIFNETSENWSTLDNKLFRNEYPRYPTIADLKITDEEKEYVMDLRPFMNKSPYTLMHTASLPRAFKLFRALGLRHLPVVDDEHKAAGMITRKDLAKYRVWWHCGSTGLEELPFTDSI